MSILTRFLHLKYYYRMSIESKFEEFECSISDDKHIVQKPIVLRCGHYICKSCIPTNSTILCTKCGETLFVNNDKESFIVKELIKRKIQDLFLFLRDKFTVFLSNFKGFILN